MRFIGVYLWGQLILTVSWKNLKVQNLIDWVFTVIRRRLCWERWVWKTQLKITYLKMWLHHYLPPFAFLSPYHLVPVPFASLLFLFFFGFHILSILRITSIQVPCTTMFLKIQTQIHYTSSWIHHPKPGTNHSLCSDSKISELSSTLLSSLLSCLFSEHMLLTLPLLYPLFPFLHHCPTNSALVHILLTSSYEYFNGLSVFHTDTRTILLILSNLISFLLK